MLVTRVKPLVGLITTITLVASMARAEDDSLPLSALGDLKIGFGNSQSVDTVQGPRVRGEVRFRAGEAYTVVLPMPAQRIEFLVAAGRTLAQGEPIARLSGPEVHHWLTETAALESQLDAAAARHEGNKPLFLTGALSAAAWADIQQRYYDLRLRHEHRQHVLDYAIVQGDIAQHDSEVAMLLVAPEPGVVTFDARQQGHLPDSVLFELVPTHALRLMVELPRHLATNLSSLNLDTCDSSVEIIESSTIGFLATAWSEGLDAKCGLSLGSIVSTTPFYQGAGYLVPKKAVFQWRSSPHIFIRRQDRILPIPVEIIGDQSDGFIVQQPLLGEGTSVLTESVSAAKGLLLGLGNH